jgi:hypothetical protein
MKLALILDTEQPNGHVYELEGYALRTHGPDGPDLDFKVKEYVGEFPLPGAMLAQMIGLDPDPAPSAFDAITHDAGGTS